MNLFSDHSAVPDMLSATELNGFRSTGTRYGLVQSFWASTARPASSTVSEVFEIQFSDQNRINSLQLDLAKFPHVARVESYDDVSGLWSPLKEADGSDCILYVTQCVPVHLPSTSSIVGHQHPQHSFMGHWQTEQIQLTPVTVSRIRVRLTRIDGATGPLNAFGKPVDYSLAVRNMSVGFVVTALEDVPRALPADIDDPSYSQPFASGDDILSSGLDFSLRTLDADRVSHDSADFVWKCEPQPDPSCVVSLFADVRTPEGDPQVIDRIWLDPVNNGSHVSLYFAQTAPSQNFVSPSKPAPADRPDSSVGVTVDHAGMHLNNNNVVDSYNPQAEGDTHYFQSSNPGNVVVTRTSDGLVYVAGTDYSVATDGSGNNYLLRNSSGSIPVDGTLITISYLSLQSVILDNVDYNYDTSLPWWVGLTVVPFFDPTDLAGAEVRTLFDCGSWNITVDSTGLSLNISNGATLMVSTPYQRLDPISIITWYDGDNVGIWLTNAFGDNESQLPFQSALTPVSKMAIGSDLARDSFGYCDVTSLVIKEESAPTDGYLYSSDPVAYTSVREYPLDEPDPSRLNAILRFDPTTELQSPAYPWCLFGGTPNKYDSMVWTPVSREFVMQRGWMHFPATRASYWKLEFTQLQAVYSDVYQPVSQQVKHFPPTEIAAYRARLVASAPPPTVSNRVNDAVAGLASFVDTPVIVSSGGTGKGYGNAEVYVAEDQDAAERLFDRQPGNWAYQPSQSLTSAPKFVNTQVHTYDTSLVTRTSKVAYQVGVRELAFGKSISSSQFDTPQYVEPLFDTNSLDPSSTWVFDDDKLALTSSNSRNARLLSNVYLSNRDVRGVQFAAQQSPAEQLIADSEFDDEAASSWHPYGNAVLGDVEQSNAFGNLLPVIRTLPVGKWEDIAPRYITWGGIEAAGTTWGDLMKASGGDGGTTTIPSFGGMASDPVPLPDGGNLYAAARVTAKQDLAAPLWVQIVDSVSGVVLGEEPIKVVKGRVTEWYASYSLNSALSPSGVTWGEVSGNVHHPSYLDNFFRADAAFLGRLTSGQSWDVGQLWNGSPGSSLHVASNQAVVTAVGQRSSVDVGIPWGQLAVTLGNLVTGTAELIDLGGFVLQANGHLIDSETGHQYAALTLASNDLLQFDVMPTAQVPSGQSSGADASLLGWSIVITQNGSFVTTISFARPVSNVRAISGAVGQQYTSFSWVPRSITEPPGTLIEQSPIPRDGQFNVDSTIWRQASDGRVWIVSGSVNQVDNGITQSLQATSGQSFDLDTDVDDMYGSLTTKIGVSGTSAANSYYVIKLDDGSTGSLYLRGDGALVQFTPSLGSVVLLAAAVPNYNDTTTVLFADTSKLSSAFVTANSLNTALPQTLVFLNGTTVTSTFQGTNLWRGTVRGVMGTDGSTVTGFTWSPNLGSTNTGSGVRTWGDLSAGGTRTWGDIAKSTKKLSNPVVLRVIQKEPTQDVWYMDSAPLFFDPLVWEFSNDGGDTWTQASTIRNNPRGVVLLDTSAPNTNQLRYRVTSYGANSWLSHLVIRPWYQGHMRGVPVRPDGPSGPNANLLDHYAPIEEDPNFQVWNLPVPREWWFAFQSMLPGVGVARIQTPVLTERVIV